jgi:gliding motility-associated-like protein
VLSENSAVNLIGQGTFGFVWTISTGTTCPSSSDTVYIQTYSPPNVANAGPDIVSDILNNLMAANAPTVGVGTWSILNGSGNFSNGNDPLSNFTAPGDGTYVLVWTISNGACAAESDTMTLIINPMLIPQVITPNGDGNNDFFEIRAIADLNGVKLEIYNRWGNVVFKDNDYKNTFKGENNGGEKLADDTYFYLLDIEGKTYKKYFIIKTN